MICIVGKSLKKLFVIGGVYCNYCYIAKIDEIKKFYNLLNNKYIGLMKNTETQIRMLEMQITHEKEKNILLQQNNDLLMKLLQKNNI